jgi:tripartite-type tricarboxylate transporter receptor subunit TctC
VQKALASPELKTTWNNSGSDIPQVSQEQFAALVADEIARWEKVAKSSKVKAD